MWKSIFYSDYDFFNRLNQDIAEVLERIDFILQQTENQ